MPRGFARFFTQEVEALLLREQALDKNGIEEHFANINLQKRSDQRVSIAATWLSKNSTIDDNEMIMFNEMLWFGSSFYAAESLVAPVLNSGNVHLFRLKDVWGRIRLGMGYGRRREFRPAPVEVNKEYSVKIEEMSKRGDAGVARIEGFIVFVPNTKPGDQVKVRITRVGRGFATAERV